MLRLLLLVALIGGVLYLWPRWRRLPPPRRRRLLWRVGGGALLLVILLLAAAGRLPWLAGLLAALLPLARVALPWLLGRLGRQPPPAGSDHRQRPAASPVMSRAEALAALGLTEGVERDEIIAAHRRLMQRVHPDRGGSDYLAARINLAKETLLKEAA